MPANPVEDLSERLRLDAGTVAGRRREPQPCRQCEVLLGRFRVGTGAAAQPPLRGRTKF